MKTDASIHPMVHDFRIDVTANAPEQALNIIGIFPDGTYTSDHCTNLAMTTQNNYVKTGERAFLSPNVLVIGVDRPNTPKKWQELGAKMVKSAPADRICALLVDTLSGQEAASMAYGCQLASWRLERYHTKARPLPQRCKHVCLVTPLAEQESLKMQRALDDHLIQSIHWARDIANRPGNDITPHRFMQCVEALKTLGVQVTVLDQSDLEKQGFGALLGVAQGSINKPYVVTATWMGTGENQPITALVGKGVTFDTGGISIKPSNNMGEMKLDKTGAVVVAATVRALAAQKAPVNVVAVLALVENMPSGSAQRPGDIVHSLSGQTIEVLDTDAEGRLILADVLTYAQNQFKPETIIDVATLTGAVRVALGPVYAGLCSDDAPLVHSIIESGQKTGELVWHLPLHEDYDKAMDSTCADMKNIAGPGFGAGSSTAAQFLKRFVAKDQKWAHLDIAGVDMFQRDTLLCPHGGSAFGIQLLTHWVTHHAAPTS
jgi:leucyl aminopeptidase